jgi:hypothetical protein
MDLSHGTTVRMLAAVVEELAELERTGVTRGVAELEAARIYLVGHARVLERLALAERAAAGAETGDA